MQLNTTQLASFPVQIYMYMYIGSQLTETETTASTLLKITIRSNESTHRGEGLYAIYNTEAQQAWRVNRGMQPTCTACGL